YARATARERMLERCPDPRARDSQHDHLVAEWMRVVRLAPRERARIDRCADSAVVHDRKLGVACGPLRIRYKPSERVLGRTSLERLRDGCDLPLDLGTDLRCVPIDECGDAAVRLDSPVPHRRRPADPRVDAVAAHALEVDDAVARAVGPGLDDRDAMLDGSRHAVRVAGHDQIGPLCRAACPVDDLVAAAAGLGLTDCAGVRYDDDEVRTLAAEARHLAIDRGGSITELEPCYVAAARRFGGL